MKHLLLLPLFLCLVDPLAHADWDAELEARVAAERAAEQQRQAAQHREIERQQAAAAAAGQAEMNKSMRQSLGTAASGKSDVEVKALYDARTKKTQEEAAAMHERLQKGVGPEADQIRKLTGKSWAELEEMSKKDPAGYERLMEQSQAAQLEELRNGKSGQQLKQITGASFEEMENMSDEQLDALQKKLEQQYGK